MFMLHLTIERCDGTGGVTIAVASPLILAQQAIADEPSTFRYRYQSVDTLGSFQRADMRADYQRRAQSTIKQFLDSSDAPSCLRLAMLDAGTYDAASKTGGICGAIILRQVHGGRHDCHQGMGPVLTSRHHGMGPVLTSFIMLQWCPSASLREAHRGEA